jgi:hypothetical protein
MQKRLQEGGAEQVGGLCIMSAASKAITQLQLRQALSVHCGKCMLCCQRARMGSGTTAATCLFHLAPLLKLLLLLLPPW